MFFQPRSSRRRNHHLAGFIIGFDNDTLDTFEHQYRFIMASGIQIAMLGLLTALPRTPLYERLQTARRLLPDAPEGDNTRVGTNFVPQKMSYDALVTGYMELWQRLTCDASICERILVKTRYLRRLIYNSGESLSERLAMLARFVLHGLLPHGPKRWFHFTWSVLQSPPGTWALVVNDWVCAPLTSARNSRNETEPQVIQRVLRQRRVHRFPDETEAPSWPRRGAGSVRRAGTLLGENRCAPSRIRIEARIPDVVA